MMNLVISPHAMRTITPIAPRTGDTAQMLDDLARHGVHPFTRTVPAAFVMNGQIVAHPTIAGKIRCGAVTEGFSCP